MTERRAQPRERVLFGAQADAGDGMARPCIVRNFSDAGARIDFAQAARLSSDVALTITRKGRSYRARVVWLQGNAAGLAFETAAPSLVPVMSDMAERLRVAEKKARVLKRRVRELSGEG